MTGPRLALPCVPASALTGWPTAAELPTPAARRRFGQAIVCALLGRPSWEIETMRWVELPPMVHLRALREDWPVLTFGTDVVILRPAEVAEAIGDWVERATAELPAVAHDTLILLLQGHQPSAPSAVITATISTALTTAARAAFHSAEIAIRSAA